VYVDKDTDVSLELARFVFRVVGCSSLATL
jgi:hypothetical protein